MNKDIAMEMYRQMLRIRLFEETAIRLYRQGEMPGRVFPCTGEEAVPVAFGMHLTDNDWITSTHRPNGHVIGKRISLKEMMAELYGKVTGSCRGKGGQMHIADMSKGILGANGIVGGGFPLANGAAFAARYNGTDQVAVCYFGDGATNQGTFHEALNLAAIWKLPVIFVCENNHYGMSMSQDEHQTIQDIAERAPAYRIPARIINGNDALEVYAAAEDMVKTVRSGEGPLFVECKTYRKTGHTSEDEQRYRPRSDLEKWDTMDPILRLAHDMHEKGWASTQDMDIAEREVRDEIQEAVEFARSSPWPEPGDALKHVYGECQEVAK
jgi:pyruvate dehydrogenase E1 component alpha subunit